ncbi:type IV pilus biogenesis protein PilM [Candidatus Hydrogenedentota bacterium]
MILSSKLVGIEISQDKVKAALGTMNPKGYRLMKLATKEIPQVEEEQREAAMALAVAEVLSENNMKGDSYLLSIPSRLAIIRTVTVPFTGERKIRQALAYELEPCLPFPVEELVVDYMSLSETESSTNLIAVGIRCSDLEYYLGILDTAGVEPEKVEFNFAPITNLYLAGGAIPLEGVSLILHCMEDQTVLVGIEDQTLIFVKPLNVPGQVFADPETVPFDSLRNTLVSFQSATGHRDFESVYITGVDLANEICARISEELGIEMIFVEAPVSGDDPAGIHPEPNFWQTVIGLTFRGIAKPLISFNFRREMFFPERVKKTIKIQAGLTGALLLLLVILGMVSFKTYVARLDRKLDSLQERIEGTFDETFPERSDVHRSKKLMEMGAAVKDKESDFRELLPYLDRKPIMLDILKEVAAATPKGQDINIKRLTVDLNGIVSMNGDAKSPDAIDKLAASLGKSPAFERVEQPTKRSENNRTSFTLTGRRVGA